MSLEARAELDVSNCTLSCDQCGAPGAPALCSGCGVARYCGQDCQRAAWRAGHKAACAGRPQRPAERPVDRSEQRPPGRSAERSAECGPWPVRCPPELLRGKLPRLDRLDSNQAQEKMAEGQAFVAPAVGLLGERLLRWDWDYLEEHLPSEERYGVMLGEGDLQKIVMSHTARNGERQVDAKCAGSTASAGQGAEEPHTASDQTRMTFREYRKDVERYKRDGGRLPYFGIHLMWRLKEGDNGFLGKIDDEMAEDLWSVRFDVIKDWQDANMLPLVQRFYLFAGVGGTLYHCHYDLQPNLHVQLTGRKRFILFPPESWSSLYPYPVHHDLDRRSMLDLDSPDDARMPGWRRARGLQVELEPGDALYIPPFWWHHVQSLTPETTSMAMWFFEHFPLSAKVLYGVGSRTEGVLLLRDVEELVGRQFADAPGEEDCSKPRPRKAAEVASFMRWLRPRVGLPTPTVADEAADRRNLLGLKSTPEAVEELLRSLVAEKRTNIVSTNSSGRELAVDVEGTLRAILASRF